MHQKILVSGLINLETTLQVDTFPLTYEPVRFPFFGVQSSMSGVGYNISKALSILGNQVSLLSLIGSDLAGRLVGESLVEHGIGSDFVLEMMPQTAQSVIIFDRTGKRQIHTDLKAIQECVYPPEKFFAALETSSLAVLCNINFNRPFLQQTRQAGKVIATDVHTIADLEDDYNQDFMAAAHILFMSDELLPCSPERWAQQIQNRYGTAIIVIGLGKEGALLAVKEDGFLERIPAVFTRPVVNSIGAGDALFSAFNHFYNRTGDAYTAVSKAMIFASYKIGGTGGADGFLTEDELEAWSNKISEQGKT